MEVPDNIQIQSPLPPFDDSLQINAHVKCRDNDVQLAELLNAPEFDISLFSMEEATLNAAVENR